MHGSAYHPQPSRRQPRKYMCYLTATRGNHRMPMAQTVHGVHQKIQEDVSFRDEKQLFDKVV